MFLHDRYSIPPTEKAMTMTPSERRPIYFEEDVAGSAISKSVVAFLASIQKDIVSRYLSPENTHRLRHGGTWTHPGLPNVQDGEFQHHSAVAEISFEDIVKNDLGVIDRFGEKLARDMERQFAQMLYSTVSEACDRTGNTVDARVAGSTLEAFAEMIEKIQFSADKYGKVNLPQIHAGPEAAASLRKGLDEAPPAFKERLEEIKARKTAEALEREAQRKARFVRYGDLK